MLHRRWHKRACLQTSKAAISSGEEQENKLSPEQADKASKRQSHLPKGNPAVTALDSPRDEAGRTEAVATGRRASPPQVTGLQLQPQPCFPRQPSIHPHAVRYTPGNASLGLPGRQAPRKGRWDGRPSPRKKQVLSPRVMQTQTFHRPRWLGSEGRC